MATFTVGMAVIDFITLHVSVHDSLGVFFLLISFDDYESCKH